MNKLTTLLIVVVNILICSFAGFVVITQSGCATQASIEKDEPFACFEARYMAREKVNSDTLCTECASAIKRDWCMKILEKEKDIPKDDKTFRDFNDCWSKGK